MTPHGSSPGADAFVASYYARHRPGYPEAFIAHLARTYRLDGRGRLLDLGCGCGQLVFRICGWFEEAVGMDPQASMIEEAARIAKEKGIQNVRLVRGGSDDLDRALGTFRLTTMARSFHWMPDREGVLRKLFELSEPEGGVVIVEDRLDPDRLQTDLARLENEALARWLPPDWKEPERPWKKSAESNEEVARRGPFQSIEHYRHRFERPWTLEGRVGLCFSLAAVEALGDRKEAFARDLRKVLAAAMPGGRLVEHMELTALLLRRPGGGT